MDKTEYVKNMEETIQDIGVEEADKDLKIYKKYETLIRNKKNYKWCQPIRKCKLNMLNDFVICIVRQAYV